MTISRIALLRHGAGVVGGITLAGCIVLDTARRQSVADPIVAPETYSAPGPMLIDAERVRTVDIHAHCDVSEALALLGADANGVLPPVKGVKEHFIVERALSERIVRVKNEKMAELCAVEFSDPRFFPEWAKAEEPGTTLFIHPQSTPELANRFKGNGWLSNVIDNPLDTTIALQHMIFEGTLDRFPTLKICAAHGGGFLPSNAVRRDRSCFVSPQNCDATVVLKKKPSEYASQIWFDALVFMPEALRHLVAQVGVRQVVLVTDHPILWEDHPVDRVLNTPSLSAADRVAILGDDARRLLNLAA